MYVSARARVEQVPESPGDGDQVSCDSIISSIYVITIITIVNIVYYDFL